MKLPEDLKRDRGGCRICVAGGYASWLLLGLGALLSLWPVGAEIAGGEPVGEWAAYLIVAGLALQFGAIVRDIMQRHLHVL